MPQVIRSVGVERGRVNCTLNWSAINHLSVVLVSASEGRENVNEVSSNREPDRFVGRALITVHNIAPFGIAGGEGLQTPGDAQIGGGVRFVLTIDWDEPLPIWVDIVLLDEAPVHWLRSN